MRDLGPNDRRQGPAAAWTSLSAPGRWLVACGLVASLAGLLAHAWSYRFLTDDGFISLRYSRNLARGHGLVFNPGEAPVEGYTNFLWVLALAACDRLGWAPERAAPALSLATCRERWRLSTGVLPRPRSRETVRARRR